MTNKEYAALWKETTAEEVSDMGLLIRDVTQANKINLRIRQAGLQISWDNMPEWYQDAVTALMCIKLSGGNIKTARERLNTEKPEGAAL